MRDAMYIVDKMESLSLDQDLDNVSFVLLPANTFEKVMYSSAAPDKKSRVVRAL